MMPVLIGSRALAHWNPEFLVRENSDWDIISDKPFEFAEWHDPSELMNNAFERYIADVVEIEGVKVGVCSSRGLKIIKRSHLHRDLFFQKHITHYHRYLSSVELSEDDLSLLQVRTEETKKLYPKGHPNLNQKVSDFFDDAVDKKYDHDYLHQLFAFGDFPAYTMMQRDPSSAWCEKDLWCKFSRTKQLHCVSEEAYVIATERMMVPRNWNYPTKLAYMKAVDKICTTLCSGWFRDFAIDHYPEVIDLYDDGKFQSVKCELEKV